MSKPNRIELEHIQCDLCGSAEYTVRYRKPDDWLWLNQYEYPVVRCTTCDLTYVNPRPTFASTQLFYPPGYHDHRSSEEHRKRYEIQYSYVRDFVGKRILDVGCARGDWLNFLNEKQAGLELHGVDAFSSGVNGDAVRFHQCVLPDANLPDGYFDLVTSWAVFEHLHTPSIYFSSVARALRAGGRFVFLVTNAESCYGKYAYKEDVPRHLYHYSERTLRRYADKHGLVLEQVLFDDRLWDGRGSGTFQHLLGGLVGADWETFYFKRLNLLQRAAIKVGWWLDRAIFATSWEARMRRSGIMIAVMRK
jgi:SAM-dependent methyltransferase